MNAQNETSSTLRAYITHAKRAAPLTREEEHELALRARDQHDPVARARLVEAERGITEHDDVTAAG